MISPRWFSKEVSLIDPDFFVAWNPRRDRWQIRVWKYLHFKQDAEFFERYVNKSLVHTTICEQDDNFNDIGYKPLDQRVLHALRISRRNFDNPTAILKEVDDANEELEKQFDKENEDLSRDAATSAWEHFHKQRFDYGKK